MESDKRKSFSARVTQANKTQLVVITYEIIEDSIGAAEAAYQAEDLIIFQKELKRTQKLLHELTGSLDFRYGLSRELLELYRFCGKCVVAAMHESEIERLDAVRSIIEKLRTAFEEVAKGDSSEGVMQNTQTLYAGLTYGRHSLHEVFMDGDEAKRGFRA